MTNKIHIGIIPDGNRRWCKENNYPLSYLKTHWVSKIFLKEIEKLYNIFKNKENDKYKILSQINEVSLYVLSLDNIIQRGNNSKNIQTNYSILKIFYAKFKENYEKYKNICNFFKLNIIGEIEYLPDEIQDIIKHLESTLNKGKFKINIAIAYCPKKDIEKIVLKHEDRIIQNQTNIDLLFRSGREKRISGFFPYHMFYTELYFSDKLWPDIRIDDIIEAINTYNKTDRRFGK